MKKFALILCSIFFVSCENNRLVGFETQVNEVISKNKTHESVRLRLDTINSFDWDRLLVLGPYSFMEKISKKEEIDLDKIPNAIQDHDRFLLIVFLHDNEGIKYIELNRTKILDQLMCDGKGYCIYPKSQSDFILKNKGNNLPSQKSHF